MAKKQDNVEIEVLRINTGAAEFLIKGTSPLIYHRMGEKAKRELLFPKGRKTAADKATSVKHNPIEEFRDSVYQSNRPETKLMAPAIWFKAAITNAALDIPGATKAQMGRLIWVDGDEVAVYGKPQLLMSVVRSSDMNRTPDVRTRAILPEWACRIRVRFIKPNISSQSVINLLAAAGVITGVGDYRQQKGKSAYGQFELVSADDKEYARILKQGRSVQEDALESPEFYDYDSEELYHWFYDEFGNRKGKDEALKLIAGGKQ